MWQTNPVYFPPVKTRDQARRVYSGKLRMTDAGKQQFVCVRWMDGPLWITLDNGLFLCNEYYITRIPFDSSIAWIEVALASSAVVRSSRSQVATPGYTTDFRREIWFIAKIIFVL